MAPAVCILCCGHHIGELIKQTDSVLEAGQCMVCYLMAGHVNLQVAGKETSMSTC